MTVTVHLHGHLAQPGDKTRAVDLPAGAMLAELIASLGLRPGDVGVAMRAGVALGHRDIPLAGGDNIDLYPVVGGGR